MADKRDEVHQALTELFRTGHALAVAPVELAAFFDDQALTRIARAYLRRDRNVTTGGRAVVLTAGPPGAGKTTALNTFSTAGYRLIDPDIAKDMLLETAENHGLLDYRLTYVLPDGRPVMPRELSAHVHALSTRVADIVRLTALADGENVIIEGTLSWAPLADVYISDLFNAGYEGLEVVDVEVPLDLALQRAKDRWWQGRQHSTGLGGRFVSADAIKGFFDADRATESKCARNARVLAERAGDELGQGTLRCFNLDPDTGFPRQTIMDRFGRY